MRSIKKIYPLALTLGILGVLAVSLISFFNFRTLISSIEERRQLFSRIGDLLHLFSALKDAETGQRGYIITGRSDYLEPYYSALKTVDAYLHNVAATISQNPQQELAFRELMRLMQLKLEELATRIETRKIEGFEKAQQEVINSEGKRYMDNIRSIINQMTSNKEQQLKQMDKQILLLANRAQFALILSIGLANFLIGLYSWFFYRDTQRLIKSQADLNQSTYSYKAVLDSSKQAIILTDTKGTIISFNKGAEKMLGYEAQELINQRSILDLYDKKSVDKGEGLAQSPLSSPHQEFESLVTASRYLIWVDSEWTMKRKDGSTFPCLQSITALKDDQNTIDRYLFVGSDITESKKWQSDIKSAYEAIQLTNLSKNQFLSSLGHDFRPPLTSILNSATSVLKNKANRLSEQEMTSLQHIVDNSQQLLSLVNRVTDLSRVESGLISTKWYSIALYDFIQEVLGELEKHQGPRASTIQFIANVPRNIKPLESDPELLKKILVNLVQNILTYLKRGQIVIGVRMDSKTLQPIQIDVIDDFVEQREEMSLADSSRKSPRLASLEPVGLELSFAQSMVKALGYQLQVSTYKDKGNVFSLILNPQEQGRQENPSFLDARQRFPQSKDNHFFNPESFKNFTVLVIDDDEEFRSLLAAYLKEYGCQTLMASTGEEALKLVKAHSVDLITLDMLMSPMNGYDIVQQLQSDFKLKAIPFAFISLVAKEIRGKISGALDFLNKPITREDVRSLLQKCSALKRPF